MMLSGCEYCIFIYILSYTNKCQSWGPWIENTELVECTLFERILSQFKNDFIFQTPISYKSIGILNKNYRRLFLHQLILIT